MTDTAVTAVTRPPTGAEYLDSLRDGREVWINGERVADVTTHPAFRASARQIARLYDALHDPDGNAELIAPTDTGSGGFTHPFFKAAWTADDLRASSAAIAAWSRLTYGWMGRTPDYKGSFLSTLGSYPQLYAPFQDNARRWYREAQERIPFLSHALVNPPVDRNVAGAGIEDVHLRVVAETDAGLVVTGAKVVATGSALTNYNFIASVTPIPAGKKEFAPVFFLPTDAPGLKLICRPSYEQAATSGSSPFYSPLTSRFDENDAIAIFDRVLVPWENVLAYDVDRANAFAFESGFQPRTLMHGCIRLAVKFDFFCGLLLKGVEMTGAGGHRGVQTRVGELLTYRNLFWTCANAMVDRPLDWPDGTKLPNLDACTVYRVMMTSVYPRAREIFMQDLGSALMYAGSDARDWQVPDVRPYLDKYLRGSGGASAEERSKLMRLAWDAVGSEFAGRHALYELNYTGNHEIVKLASLQWAQRTGQTRGYEEFVERCMDEYDTSGWLDPRLNGAAD